MTSIEEIGAPARAGRDPVAVLKAARDGDGDGRVYDGTARERPAPELDRATVARAAAAFRLSHPVRLERVPRGRTAAGGSRYGLYLGLEHGVHHVQVDESVPRVGALATLAHELVHARQREQIGERFMDTYCKLHAVHGYGQNPLEVEARRGSELFMEHLERGLLKVRDGDGDGWVYDGTPRMRPAFSPASREGATALPVLPWVDPPPPRGRPGQRRPGGFSASGKTVTALGDLAEEVVYRLGLQRAQEIRQGALDAIGDGWGYEIKARSVESAGYKVGMRSADMRRKIAEAERLGVRPGLIMVVTDEGARKAYIYHRAGIANGRLRPSDGFHFAGEVKL